MIKTNKNIKDFYNKAIDPANKLMGLIYLDEETNSYYQNIEYNYNISRNSIQANYMLITEETQYRPDKIAHMLYGDERLYWLVLIHNNIVDPFELEIGTEIEILDISVLIQYINSLSDYLKLKR